MLMMLAAGVGGVEMMLAAGVGLKGRAADAHDAGRGRGQG